MTAKLIPERVVELWDWLKEGGQPVEQVLTKVRAILAEIHEEIDGLQHEAQMVEGVLGFLAEHHLPNHGSSDTVNVSPSTGFATSRARSEAIRGVALDLAHRGKKVITPADVLELLNASHIDLEVKYPTTVIGNVLARSEEFKRLRRNQFALSEAWKDWGKEVMA